MNTSLRLRLGELRRLDRDHWLASTVELARRILAEHPRRANTWMRLGDALRAMGRFEDAEAALRQALRFVRRDFRAWVTARLGALHSDRGDLDLATRWFRRACQQDPREATWHIFLGATLARRGRLLAAANAHQRATRCRRGCIEEAWLNLGFVRRCQGRHAEAMRCFRNALKRDARYAEAKRALRDLEHLHRLARQGRSVRKTTRR